MLKTMLFSSPSGSESKSWVLEFGTVNGYHILHGGIHSISIDKNGILYIGCLSYIPLTGRDRVATALFAKINNKGEILWQNYFKHNSNNSSSTNSCVTTIGNSIVVGGQETSTLGVKTNTQLGLYSANGDAIATTGITAPKILGTSATVSILGISSNDNYVYAYGNYIAKLTKNLNSVDWIKPIIENAEVGIKCDSDNDYIYFYGNVPISSSRNNFCVGSLSSTGELRWSEKIGEYSNKGTCICVTSDAVYVCGYLSGASAEDSYGIIAKYTKSGSLLWIEKITTANIYTICSDNIGNIYIGDSIGKLIKLSSDGNILSCIRITHPNYNATFIRGDSIQTDARGNIYFNINASNYIYLVKLTKNDIKQIATTPLTIGPLTFENISSPNVIPSSISTTSYPTGIIDNDNSTKYSLTSSTFTFTESNLTPELHYKG